jgi:hypothetical protein
MRPVTLIALLFVLVCNVGCLSPIALTSMGTAGSDAPVVFSHLHAGQGESFCIAKYDDVVSATMRAGEVLSLEVKQKKVDKDQAFFRYYDATKERIDFFVVRRSDTMTSMKFDVGWFGSVALGHLMTRQILAELSQSKSFLEHWAPERNN